MYNISSSSAYKMPKAKLQVSNFHELIFHLNLDNHYQTNFISRNHFGVFIFLQWKYVCQVTDHGTAKDRPNRIFNTIFKPLPLAADLLWVDRLGEVRSIRRNELYALTSISKLINHIFKVAKIGPDHVTDIHQEKGWT